MAASAPPICGRSVSWARAGAANPAPRMSAADKAAVMSLIYSLLDVPRIQYAVETRGAAASRGRFPQMPSPPPTDARRLRERIEEDLGEGRFGLARQHMALLWEHDPTMAAAGYLLRCRARMGEQAALIPCRVAILRSFTVEPLVPLLRAGALAGGIDLEVHLGGFNAYRQEVLDPGGSLYRFEPALAILAVQASDLPPEPERAAAAFRESVEAFRAHSGAALVIHDLAGPHPVNAELGRLASAYPGVYVLPFAETVARHGGGSDARNQAA